MLNLQGGSLQARAGRITVADDAEHNEIADSSHLCSKPAPHEPMMKGAWLGLSFKWSLLQDQDELHPCMSFCSTTRNKAVKASSLLPGERNPSGDLWVYAYWQRKNAPSQPLLQHCELLLQDIPDATQFRPAGTPASMLDSRTAPDEIGTVAGCPNTVSSSKLRRSARGQHTKAASNKSTRLVRTACILVIRLCTAIWHCHDHFVGKRCVGLFPACKGGEAPSKHCLCLSLDAGHHLLRSA